MTPADYQVVLSNVNNYTSPVVNFINNNEVVEFDIDLAPTHIDNISRLLLDIRHIELHLPPPLYLRICAYLQDVLNRLEAIEDRHLKSLGNPVAPPGRSWEISPTGVRRLVIETAILEDLCAEGFTDGEITEFLGCSQRTIKRRRQQLGILKREFPELSDEDIAGWVLYGLKYGSGDKGEKGVQAGLQEVGVRVRRDHLRRVLSHLNRGNTGIAPYPIVRRVYSVPCVNAMWHIDGHHKLIPWKIVIHGGIDGFSRMMSYITYLPPKIVFSRVPTLETHLEHFP
ncbi:hypothetical protein M231_07432 [Tremella mesenterica]|uniref:Integrase core domain-containing protein n=1 Tax=Tremella mesenterica TaxID=5217 RepID=A0A4Q1B974_TREME|nr:hypothetical protein M231_07432 [Tremella mesenterica]